MSDTPSLKDLILQKAKEGKVVFMTYDGPLIADLDEFIKQPTQGLLYDLNRGPEVVLSFLDDPKWVNDYAVGLVIGRLKDQIDEAKKEFNMDTGNPLEECCPGCERKGYIAKAERSIMFKIDGKWAKIPYRAYVCLKCRIEFITDDDPFQKAKDLGWIKG